MDTCPKKFARCPKERVLSKRTQIAVKTNPLTILVSNKTVQENFKWLLVEPFKTALFRVATKAKVLVFISFDSFFIVLLIEKISLLWISTTHI